MTWDGAPAPDPVRIGPRAVLRALRRGVPVVVVVAGGLFLLSLVRLIERPLCGLNRPVTPWITQGVCRAGLFLMGIRRVVRGTVMTGTGAVVANHVSWLDIFALNASKRIYFVSKSEVAGWPGIGLLARATGTLFIRRDPREARVQAQTMEDRLRAGHRLLFFPEGTSTDGVRLLSFKTTLFAAFFSPALSGAMQVQPVTLIYRAPPDEAAAFYGWWGEQSVTDHMLRMLVAPRHGVIEVVYHAPLRVAAFVDRKALARAAEEVVRTELRAAGVLMTDA
ncbi:MAG: lysophospholipid acyltransferase family protein [Jannaschia sp.]